MDSSPSTDAADRSTTATRILDAAQALMQRRGYNAVSYGDLAEQLDLTTAAIHYHFPSKADLGQTLVARYRENSAERRAAIRRNEDRPRAQLERYVEMYAGLLEEGGLCLCGVLAADAATLPDPVHDEVRQFFAEQEAWLTEVIADAQSDDVQLRGYDSPEDVAELFLAVLEGALFTSQNRDPDAYRATLGRLIDTLTL